MPTHTLEALKAGKCRGFRRLKLSSGLKVFPKEILELLDTLEILDLSGNPLTHLPKDFHRLHKLKIAFFSDCNFSIFPRELAQCRSLEMIAFRNNNMTSIPEDAFPRKLRWLILTKNLIEYIPRSIGQCHRLQKCMLAGNRLVSLPDEMQQCQKLGLLRLSSNRISKLPSWLFDLPELSFLSFAGNPCVPPSEHRVVLPSIAWVDLKVGYLLGEGASGIISKALWRINEDELNVAVKLFKSGVTSDGSPADEMNACITAGKHPNLIDPLGKLYGHPDKEGLVLQLVPPQYDNLGLPPTIESCTRDVFGSNSLMSIEKCEKILICTALAAAHLHSRGISHGDLYAHNLLVDRFGDGLLGDFGAATIYGTTNDKAGIIERLEVLAYGHLIEDMLTLVARPIALGVFSEKAGYSIEILNALHYRCTNPVVSERPSFREITNILVAM